MHVRWARVRELLTNPSRASDACNAATHHMCVCVSSFQMKARDVAAACTWKSLYRLGAEKGMRPKMRVYKHAPKAYTSVGRPR